MLSVVQGCRLVLFEMLFMIRLLITVVVIYDSVCVS